MSELVEQLRGWADINDMGRKPDKEDLRRQAADRIEHLERVLADVRSVFSYIGGYTANDMDVIIPEQIAAIDEALK